METDLSRIVSIQWTATFVPNTEIAGAQNHARPSSALRLRGVVEGRAWGLEKNMSGNRISEGRAAGRSRGRSPATPYRVPVLKIQAPDPSGFPARSLMAVVPPVSANLYWVLASRVVEGLRVAVRVAAL